MCPEAMLKSLLVLITLLATQSSGVDERALQLFRQGEAMIGTDSNYSEDQARCFREALALSPGFNEARYNLIIILLAREKYREAEEQSSLLISNEPDSVQGYLLRAESRLMAGDVDKAAEDLDIFLKRNPEDARSRELQGEVFFRKGAFADAAAAYQQALKLGRDGLGIRVNIGLSLLNCGETAAAAEAFSSLVEEYPDTWEGYYWQGVALRTLGQLDKAVSALEKAEAIDPDNEKVREELIEVFLGKGDLEKAGIRINSKKNKTASDYANLALLAKVKGNLDDALAYLKTAAGFAPENASILAGLGDLQVYAKKNSEAITTYRRVLEINPEDFDTLLNLGSLFADQGDLAESRKVLEKAVSLEPGSAEAHFRLALVLDKMEDSALARKAYEKSLELGYQSLVAHFRLGFFLAEEGDGEGAMRHLEIAVSGDPKKFMPYLIREVRKVHSPLDRIRYTAPFSGLIERYKEYWAAEDEDDPEEPLPVPEAPSR